MPPALEIAAVKDSDVGVGVSLALDQITYLVHQGQGLGFFGGGLQHDHIIPVRIIGSKLLVDLSGCAG